MALRSHFDDEPTEQLPAAELIGGRYRLEQQIGEGNVAVTFRARDVVLRRIVALKMLRSEFVADQTSLVRFAREARAAAAVNHPNVVPIYDYGTHDGQAYLVMSYVTGRTLKQVIAEDGPLPPDAALRLTRQLLRGLNAIHAAGIIHRDVKPQNILVGEDGIARLTDFGIARTNADDKLTAHGTTVGTVAYMAPEQIEGDSVSAATDLYAMGAVLFESLTGHPPFEYEHPAAVMHAHLHQAPPAPSELVKGIPPTLDQVVQTALAKDPARRFRSAINMARAIDGVLAVLAARRSTSRFGRASAWLGPLAFAVIALAVLGTAIAATLDGWPGGRDPTDEPPPTEQPADRPAAQILLSPTATVTVRVIRTVAPSETLPPPSETPPPTATKSPTTAPTATQPPPTQAPTETPEPAIVPVNNEVATEEVALEQDATVPLSLRFSADQWQGGYYRGDAEWYGRPWTAVYGAQSQHSFAALIFSLDAAPAGPATLTITGLDDEWEGNNPILISVNGLEIFSGSSPFPSWDGVGQGEQAAWTAIDFQVPEGVLREGSNEIVLANQSPSANFGTPPYVLVSDAHLEFGG